MLRRFDIIPEHDGQNCYINMARQAPRKHKAALTDLSARREPLYVTVSEHSCHHFRDRQNVTETRSRFATDVVGHLGLIR